MSRYNDDGTGCLTWLFIIFIIFAIGWNLSGSNDEKTETTEQVAAPAKPEDMRARAKSGETILVKTAPDGTKLWFVYTGEEYVYFSTAGTSTDNQAVTSTKTGKPL